MTLLIIAVALIMFFIGRASTTNVRTEADEHRATCYHYMLQDIKDYRSAEQKLQSRINEQEASVKANREMYKIAENVVRQQAAEIEALKARIEELEYERL